MKFIKTFRSPNFNLKKKNIKVEYVIIHYTAIKIEEKALIHLCEKKNKVSSHFFINKSGTIYLLVDLKFRAWHAGKSYWNNYRDINSKSIGIELSNTGHHLDFENYSKHQITSLINLLSYIKEKFNIKSKNILGHSDVAPYRKIDPGEKFPWLLFVKKKIVKFPKKITKKKFEDNEASLNLILNGSKSKRALYMLNFIGYEAKPALNSKKKFVLLMKVYQMHFRNSLINGKLDEETYNLIASHYNDSLTK